MYRMSVLYGTPEDPEAFDTYYRDVHVALARRMKGLTRWTLTTTAAQNGPLPVGVHLVADLYTDSQEAMAAVLASPEGQAAAADVANFATGGATFVEGYEEEVDLT